MKKFARKEVIFSDAVFDLRQLLKITAVSVSEDYACDAKDCILKQTWSHRATSTCAIGAEDDQFAVPD